MKVTLKNIENAENGYIGTIVDFRYGQTNLLNHCYKTGDEIRVEDAESQGPTFFTVKEFANAYKNRKIKKL